MVWKTFAISCRTDFLFCLCEGAYKLEWIGCWCNCTRLPATFWISNPANLHLNCLVSSCQWPLHDRSLVKLLRPPEKMAHSGCSHTRISVITSHCPATRGDLLRWKIHEKPCEISGATGAQAHWLSPREKAEFLSSSWSVYQLDHETWPYQGPQIEKRGQGGLHLWADSLFRGENVTLLLQLSTLWECFLPSIYQIQLTRHLTRIASLVDYYREGLHCGSPRFYRERNEPLLQR